MGFYWIDGGVLWGKFSNWKPRQLFWLILRAKNWWFAPAILVHQRVPLNHSSMFIKDVTMDQHGSTCMYIYIYIHGLFWCELLLGAGFWFMAMYSTFQPVRYPTPSHRLSARKRSRRLMSARLDLMWWRMTMSKARNAAWCLSSNPWWHQCWTFLGLENIESTMMNQFMFMLFQSHGAGILINITIMEIIFCNVIYVPCIEYLSTYMFPYAPWCWNIWLWLKMINPQNGWSSY